MIKVLVPPCLRAIPEGPGGGRESAQAPPKPAWVTGLCQWGWSLPEQTNRVHRPGMQPSEQTHPFLTQVKRRISNNTHPGLPWRSSG